MAGSQKLAFVALLTGGVPAYVGASTMSAEIDWYAGADIATVHHRNDVLSETDWMSHKSWIGLAGQADVAEGYRLHFVVEHEFAVNDSHFDSDSFAAGDHYLGIETPFGGLRLGAFDTPLKVTVDQTELFSDGPGDLEPLLSSNAHDGDVLAYHTPEGNPWRMELAVLAGEGSSAHAYAAGLSWKSGPLHAAVSTELDVADGDTDIIRTLLQWNGADWHISFLREMDDSVGRKYASAAAFQKSFGAIGLQIQHIQSDINFSGSRRSSVGFDYRLSANVKVYSYLVRDIALAGAASERYWVAGLAYWLD